MSYGAIALVRAARRQVRWTCEARIPLDRLNEGLMLAVYCLIRGSRRVVFSASQSVLASQLWQDHLVRAALYVNSAPQFIPGQRIASLDAMRRPCRVGLDSCQHWRPVLYNLPVYMKAAPVEMQLLPSIWDGATVYDLMLPLFCFIVGASIAPALQGRYEKRANRHSDLASESYAASCFCLHLESSAKNLIERWSSIRLVGAYQRIAVCYLCDTA